MRWLKTSWFFKSKKGEGKGALAISGEAAAAKTLKEKGIKVLERNFRTRLGEIDIIAMDRETLVFVEVKTRSNSMYGSPEESVDGRKKRHIIRVAMDYILRNPQFKDFQVRFDVMSVFSKDGTMTVEHIKSAFDADAGYP